LSPVEVLESALSRIDTFNPVLNAFLGRLDGLAREQAVAAERAWRTGQAGPLCGVPVSVKDTFHIEGHVATYGSLVFRDNVSSQDSGVVRRLRAAGAVFTGRTNTSEFAQSATTENNFFDDCHNPWDLARTTGGSSGGAAASVAAGLSTIGVGADGGGSIRIPAAFTGLFGIKPTYGLCKDEGGLSAMSDFISPGPFSWRVDDARIMLGVLADRQYSRNVLKKGLRIAWCARPSNNPHDPEMVRVTEAAVKKLADLGHHVIEQDLDLEGWQGAFGPLVLHNEHRERGHLLDSSADILTGYERRSLEIAKTLSTADVEQGHKLHEAYRVRIQKMFEEFDLIVTPTTATPAFPIKERPVVIDGKKVNWLWGAFPCTAPFNVSGNPAATLPCGFVNSLPVGLQIVGPALCDELVMDLAEDLEEALAIDQSVAIEKWALSPANA
jgi:aspartyl-tRNA(Asn)/glutamyl-tRNA(Gln) amidotransferase subunit A